MGSGHKYKHNNILLFREWDLDINLKRIYYIKERETEFEGLTVNEQREELLTGPFNNEVIDELIGLPPRPHRHEDFTELLINELEDRRVKPYEHLNDVIESVLQSFHTNESYNRHDFSLNHDMKAIKMGFHRLTYPQGVRQEDARLHFDIEIGGISDGYNEGIFTWLECGNECISGDIDGLSVLNQLHDDPDCFDRIMSDSDFDDMESFTHTFQNIKQQLNTDDIHNVLGNSKAIDNFDRLKRLVYEGFEDDIEDMRDRDLIYLEKLAKAFLDDFKSGTAELSQVVEKLAENFNNTLLDGVIKRFDEPTFYYATSAWTSAMYDPKTELFSGPLATEPSATLTP
ncbi:hypothetical protein AB6D11_00280 [Vibrio splendidus]